MYLTYEQLKYSVESNLIKQPNKLSFNDFYNWSLLSDSYNFFQLFPYIQSGGCITRTSTMLDGEYIKLASLEYSPDVLMFTKFKNGQPLCIISLFYEDLIHDDWRIVYEVNYV